ncbi:MAG TPA: cytochrome c oxidase subunit 3 [Candidatus Polarisedimenticolia bacterium]|nr:cytochrome c oxidase subunit 3 [Candidatus Polarisedimenticolia bacterium]
MNHAAAMSHPIDPAQPSPLSPDWGKIMMWLFLMSDAMSFAGLLCAYAAVRMSNPLWPVPSSILGVPLTALNTFILICSSVTMVKAVSAIQHGNVAGLKKFLALTMLGGASFLGIQAYEWTHLINEGLTVQKSLFGATFYVLTGFHGCHVLSGVIYLGFILAAAARGRYSAQRWGSVEIVGLYWHFVDLIWILVFTFVYLI